VIVVSALQGIVAVHQFGIGAQVRSETVENIDGAVFDGQLDPEMRRPAGILERREAIGAD
jgi:hypothetical protein